MLVTDDVRKQLADEVHRRVDAFLADHGVADGPRERHCLPYCHFGIQVLREQGLEAQPQAGSARWRIRDNDEVPEGPTVMEYKFDPSDERSQWAMSQGFLPEFHAWIAVLDEKPEETYIIDFGTKALIEVTSQAVPAWRGVTMPDYYWRSQTEIEATPQRDASYGTDKLAGLMIIYVLIRQFDPDYLSMYKEKMDDVAKILSKNGIQIA